MEGTVSARTSAPVTRQPTDRVPTDYYIQRPNTDLRELRGVDVALHHDGHDKIVGEHGHHDHLILLGRAWHGDRSVAGGA